MIKINWWVILIIGIWFSAAIGNFSPFAESTEPFAYAFLVTICIGIGYFLILLFRYGT